jgi:hypothetical protein
VERLCGEDALLRVASLSGAGAAAIGAGLGTASAKKEGSITRKPSTQ